MTGMYAVHFPWSFTAEPKCCLSILMFIIYGFVESQRTVDGFEGADSTHTCVIFNEN